MERLWLCLLVGCTAASEDTAPTKEVAPIDTISLGSACGPVDEPGDDRALRFSDGVPRNLIVISIDTLRRDRVGRYNGGTDTPFLDARLAESVALDNLLACANWTLPGVVCAVSGQRMMEHGMEPFDPSMLENPDYFPQDMRTMATVLQEQGWATSLVTTSKLFSDLIPTGNGFDTVTYNSNMNAEAVSDATRDALSALQARADGAPWYLQVHFRDPHGPYNPPGRYQGDLAGVDLSPYDPRTSEGIQAIYGAKYTLSESERAQIVDNIEVLYGGELRYLDDQLAELWETWQTTGVLDDTLVVFWSDHGEQFFEHDAFQHGATLHQEEALAVGAFWAKGLPAASVTLPTTHTDIPATILDLYGITGLGDGVPVGALGNARARVSIARDKDHRPLFSVDREGHRLLYSWDGARAYYQTPDDPEERTDRYDPSNADVICLWEHLQPVIDAFDQSNIGPPVEPGP